MSISQINNIIDSEIYKLIKNEDNCDIVTYCDTIIKKNTSIDKNIITNRLQVISNNRVILRELMAVPIIEQRTKAWFDARDTRLTASDLCDAIKKGATSDRIAKKKAKITIDKTNYNSVPALKWGTMYEAMASRCYSQVNNDIIVHDFGLICDKNNEHFGASPDGINDLGVMIEIKCPFSRKIVDGFIPDKYKMQIQIRRLPSLPYLLSQPPHPFRFYNFYPSQNLPRTHIEAFAKSVCNTGCTYTSDQN